MPEDKTQFDPSMFKSLDEMRAAFPEEAENYQETEDGLGFTKKSVTDLDSAQLEAFRKVESISPGELELNIPDFIKPFLESDPELYSSEQTRIKFWIGFAQLFQLDYSGLEDVLKDVQKVEKFGFSVVNTAARDIDNFFMDKLDYNIRDYQETTATSTLDGPMRNGGDRPGDEKIKESAAKKIKMADGKLVRTLEVGAGVSYPWLSGAVGGPWLSRKLKTEYGDAIDVTVSDIAHTNIIIEVKENGQIRQYYNPGYKYEEQNEALENATSGCQRNPDGTTSFTSVTDNPELMAKNPVLKDITSRSNASKSKFFVRPLLDPDFERAVFGVKAIPGLSFYEAASARTGDHNFDVIFARHLDPTTVHEGTLRKVCSRKINEDGEILINVAYE